MCVCVLLGQISHLQTVQRVRLGEHLELGELPDESDRFVLRLDVDLILLPDLKQKKTKHEC